MNLLTHLKSVLYLTVIASSIPNDLLFPKLFIPVEASLLQIRTVTRDSNKLQWEFPEGKFLLASNPSDWKNITVNDRIGGSIHRGRKLQDFATSAHSDLQGEETMEPTTTSIYFNYSGEQDKVETPRLHEERTNDSDEIFLSQNETDSYAWTGFGWKDVTLVTLFCSIIAGTVAGNMLVIAAVATTRRLRTVTNCFVMSLAVADWLVGMFVMPPKVFLYFVKNEWRFGRVFCDLWISLDILLCTASILSLCAISIDRYLAITRPLAYSRRRRSKRLALSMISCVWIAAVVITSPPIFGWYDKNRNTESECNYNQGVGYVVYSALGSFFLPLFVMLYVYARIACVITRRQRSIQKLHARGDRKSQYCSDAEEPLHQKERDDDVAKGESGGESKQAQRSGTRLTSSTGLADDEAGGETDKQEVTLKSGRSGHRRGLSERKQTTSQNSGSLESNSFLGRFRLSSCTTANNDELETGRNTKKQAEHLLRRDKFGDNTQDTPGAGVAATSLSLPDPATLTLTAGIGPETSSSSATEPDSTCGSHSINNSQVQGSQQQRPGGCCTNQNQRNHHHYVSRMKTGSRLCHHSIATASPQKNIHRVHQTSSSSGRGFGDGDAHHKNDGGCRSLDRSPRARVWTVEATSPTSSSRKTKEGKTSSANCRSCSYEHELADSANSGADKAPSQMESVMMMECSPAGNPASLMSAASASGNNTTNISISPSPHDKRSPYTNRIQSRIYQPHSTQNSHHRIIQNNQLENPSHPSAGGIQRARSMKFVPHILGSSDQNHNGGTASRDFSSGRIASFKRETKTAQTLAAVVGGFIICWLPFFVAYVMGPFTPSSDTIPDALMDALIWLGWSNSAINPFIYAFYSADFRSAFWRLTVHKCEALLRNRNQARNSPRRYEDPPPPPPQQHRVSS